MMPLAGRPVLTAGETRATEQQAIAGGISVEALMARAAAGIAAAVARLAAGAPILFLCGPGNNGGDGYLAAQLLAEAGHEVRVAASGPPAGDAARAARARWKGAVEHVSDAAPAPVLVDALFGTGLTRPLDAALAGRLRWLAEQARLTIAIDLPSGVGTDDGSVHQPLPCFDVTLALLAAKPAHLLQPAAAHCGAVRILDIGVAAQGEVHVLERPQLPPPGPGDHKYSRGMVAVVAGPMAGASLLAATAAMRAGAGYVALLGGAGQGPHALVHRPFDHDALSDERIGALVIGPGLGRDDAAGERLDRAIASRHPLVIDGDALHLLGERMPALRQRQAPIVLTPHAGEFAAIAQTSDGSKIERARRAASDTGAVIVFKGADTVIAAPDGRVRIDAGASHWLASAGTGDVLSGAIAAVLASGIAPLDAAAAGVWLHGDAARRLGAAFIADDLAAMLTVSRASL